jgi:glycosyltransferase involved in cell wall biosynthesis
MNVRRRVLIVTRHYWPHTSDQTQRLRAWARSIAEEGFSPLVITHRWNPAWPQRLTCEEVPVILLDRHRGARLISMRYGRTLVDCVLEEMSSAEAIYCDAADEDALALLTHLPKHRRPPIVVRFDSPNLSASGASFAAGRSMQYMADVCRKADAVIVTNAIAHQQLLGQGIAAQSLQRWSDDMVYRVDRSPAGQSSARHILAHTNHDLFLRGQDRLIVCPGELNAAWKIDYLIKALGPLVEHYRTLKLWLLGDGPGRSEYYEQLQHQGWHRIVSLPGCFTDMADILQVADLCIFPTCELGWQWLIPNSLFNSIPVRVADGPLARQSLGAAAEQLCFRSNDIHDLQTRVRSWLKLAPQATQPTLAIAREQLATQFSRSGPKGSLRDLLAGRATTGNARRAK